MARPRTKGDPIQFRLPLASDQEFAKQAGWDGLTLAEYAAQIVRRHVTQRSAQRR